MKRIRLYILLFAGVCVGYILNRVVSLYLKATGLQAARIENTITALQSSLLHQPFAFDTRLYPLFAFLGSLLGAFLIYLARDTRIYMPGQEHGDAHYASVKELSPFVNKNFAKNRILSQKIFLNRETEMKKRKIEWQRNNNGVVIGGSGSGKTFFCLKPNLSQFYASYVITDTKGTLVRETGQMMENHGYKVKVFDIDTMMNTDSFNPFVYIHDEITLRRVIQLVIEATNGENARKGEPFWDRSEELLLSAVFGYLYYIYRGEGTVAGTGELPALYDISDLIRLLERSNPDVPSPLEELFYEFEEEFGSDNYAVLQFKSFQTYKGETRSSVLAIATSRFAMFDLKQVRRLLKKDTLEIDKWGTEKFAVYLTLPDIDKTYNFLTTMIFLLAFRTLEFQADNVYHGSLPVPVEFDLDEFANLGKIFNIKEALSVFRSRNINIWIYLQSLNQLHTMYKEDWNSLIANCDSIVYLSGGTEKETVKFFSERGDKQTIYEKRYSENRGGQGSINKSTPSLGHELISKAQVYALPRNECLVAISSMPLYRGKKYDPTCHPRFNEWSEGKPGTPNYYDYHKFFTDEEEWEYNTTREGTEVDRFTIDLTDLEEVS